MKFVRFTIKNIVVSFWGSSKIYFYSGTHTSMAIFRNLSRPFTFIMPFQCFEEGHEAFRGSGITVFLPFQAVAQRN